MPEVAPLRIALLSVHSCPLGKLGSQDTGGMNVYVRELARSLGRLGHQTDVFTLSHGRSHGEVVALGEGARLVHLRVGVEQRVDKLEIYPFLSDFACQVQGFAQKSGLRYDLVHSHYWLSGWAGCFLQVWWGVPHLTMFHTLGLLKNQVNVGEGETELRIEAEREVIRRCQGVIVATEQEKQGLVSGYGAPAEKVSVVSGGVDLELFRPRSKIQARRHLGLGPSAKVALYVGRLDKLKGIEQFLRAGAYFRERQGFRLLVVGGDKPERKRSLQTLARGLGMEKVVSFLGTVNQKRLPCLYSAADLCVVPSYYESFGLAALESLACGTPVVSTRVGGMAQIIRQDETGSLVDTNSPAILASAMEPWLWNGKSKRGLGKRARASVAPFAWESIAQTILQVYEAALQEARGSPVTV